MSERRIRNWDKWQSYRKDRGQPPWIKIHREVMRNPEWVSLSDAQRGQLVAIWLLAADRNGVIPASPLVIQKLCHLDTEPDLQLFTDKGFIEPDANMTPDRRQHDAPETEAETETETETEQKEDTASAVTSIYVFEADPIRLTKKDFERWQEAYPNLNLRGELLGLQQWAAKQPSWFHAVQGALTKRSREIQIAKDKPQVSANQAFWGNRKIPGIQ